MASLSNCLNTICGSMGLPKLLDFERENRKLKHVMEENERLKEQIMELSKSLNQGTRIYMVFNLSTVLVNPKLVKSLPKSKFL